MTAYYVKTGGDGTGGTTDPGTGGDWSSAYPDVDAATNAGPAGDGDILYVSDAHVELDQTQTFNIGGVNTARNPLQVISVEDLDTSVDSKGATCQRSIDGSWFFRSIYCYGMIFENTSSTPDDFSSDADHHHSTFDNCDFLSVGGSDDQFDSAGARNWNVVCNDCSFSYDHTGDLAGVVTIKNGGSFTWRGGSVLSLSSGNILAFSYKGHDNNGAVIRVTGADLSAVTSELVGTTGNNRTTDNQIDAVFNSCILSSGVALANEAFSSPRHHAQMWNCDDTSGDMNERFEDLRHNGSAVNEGTVRRTTTAAMPNGNFLTVKVVTTSDCSIMEPYDVQIPAFYNDLSVSGRDVVTVYLTSDQTLDDLGIQAYLLYPDGTTAVQNNVAAGFTQAVTNGFSRRPLATANTLATTAGLWTSAKTNQYKIELDTSGDIAQASPNVAPQLWFRFTDASQTIYIDRAVGYS